MNRAKRLLISMLTLLCCCTGTWASSIPGALSGRFTINASGEKVVFSQGNLQYVGTWQFAENQWDCFSTSQYNDHRDLFGWGTGDAPNKVSDNNGDYGTFTDWGTNAITNGGNTENSGWRTLTKDEWVYLFYSRENAATLFGFGSVNGMNGLIILPDNWTTPEGASFTASTTLGLTNQGSYYHNDNNDNYSHNTYTAEQWAVMESAGAVFLPAAAYRHGVDSNINFTDLGGFYWSSTPSSTDKAYYLNFYYNDLDPQFNEMRYGGRPVRLVKDYQLQQDAEGNYLIGSAYDWKLFATLVQTTPAANAKMTADINLGTDQTMVGTSSVPYQGSFDGQGHTLTVAYDTSESIIAPFRYVAGSTQTIENLHVNGTIYTTGCAAGGVVCSIAGNLTIKKCWVSAQIRTQNEGGSYGTIGGICSYCDPTENCTIVIEDCLFSGAILYSSYCGSFMSHVASSKSSVTIRRGLSIGTWSGGNGYQSGTFIRPVLYGIRNIENAFYRYSCGEVQGTHATDEELADGTTATALQAGRAETVWVQDATSGQPRLDVFNHPITTYDPYVHPTSHIINLSELTEDYIAQDGDVLTGTTGYSVQIAADATITLSDVTITNYRKSPIECLGNATINIEDGTVNTLRDSDEDSNSYGRPALAFGPSGTTLTINGNTGRLIAIGGRFSSAIGCRANRVAYGGLIINGGVISAHGNSNYTSGIGAVGADDSHGSYCGDITINGGTINVAASDGIGIGAAGANSCGAITINGGTITSSAVRSTAIGGNCSKVVINGGNINASTTTSVGIGSSGVVYIEGGTIVASASDGEGVGISGDKGVLIRSSITSLTAYGANAIRGGTVYISENLNDVTEGNTRTLTPKASFEPESDLVQDGAGYYLIADVTNWKEFAILSQIETSPKGKLVADINLGDEQAIIGSFDGLFDGQGHTLTVNLTSTANVCGVFRYVADGATIQNLRIAGTINGAHRWIGGFVGEGTGTYYINNCISSVTINTTYSGDGVQGGFVAAQRGTLYMNDCIFDGVFNGPNAYTWGGFVGWYYGGSTLTNCLVLCDKNNVRMSDVATFIAMSGTLNNCYYKTPIGTAQGTQATTAELADGSIAYKLQADRVDLIWGQRIGIDAEPVLTNDESYRVYKSKNGGYTNNPAQAYDGLQQDAEGYYLLGSVWDWQNFAELVQTTPKANAKMTADIDLGNDQTMVGSYTTKYSGIFDGQGHKLTINYNTSSMSIESGQDYLGAAPFRDIEGATIRNVHTAGSITADKIGVSGLVGWAYGKSTIENCWSDVNLVSSNSTADGFTGLVVFMYGTSINITDCVYTGLIQSASKRSHGGLIAYHPYGTSVLTNCLVILDEGSDTNQYSQWGITFFTLDRFASEDQTRGTYTNCYYYRDFGVAQGTKVTDTQLSDGTTTTALQAGRSEIVWVQDPVTNQPMLAIFANGVTLTDGDNLSALETFAGKTCTVAYSRSFTAGMSSTVCLPFAFAKGSVGTFYTFTGISKSGSEYIADMTEYTGDNLEANTPYLFLPSATGNVDFGGTYAIPASLTAGSTVSGDWTFLGTYETVSWTEAPTGIYGFSAQNVDAQGISQGEFVKVGAYVRIRPMRCYLKYDDGNSDYAGARSMTRGAEAEQLPETIKVRLIGANGEVTSIGSLQTKTGEVTFDSDAWYTLEGVQLNGKPTRKGIYVNNGKKVIIK